MDETEITHVGRFTVLRSVVLPSRFVVRDENGETVVRKPRRTRKVKRFGYVAKPGKPAIFQSENDAIAFANLEERRRVKAEREAAKRRAAQEEE